MVHRKIGKLVIPNDTNMITDFVWEKLKGGRYDIDIASGVWNLMPNRVLWIVIDKGWRWRSEFLSHTLKLHHPDTVALSLANQWLGPITKKGLTRWKNTQTANYHWLIRSDLLDHMVLKYCIYST